MTDADREAHGIMPQAFRATGRRFPAFTNFALGEPHGR